MVSGKKIFSCFSIWASPRENLSSVVCEHQMRRPACAYAQSDQRLCYSLIVKYHIQAWYKRNFNFLASLCSWAGWFESRFVGNPEDRFCRDEAHIKANINYVTHGAGHFWPHEYNFNKLGRGLLVDASYQISRLKALWFKTRRFFHVSPYISLCKTCDPGAGHFWPQGHNLNKLVRGP